MSGFVGHTVVEPDADNVLAEVLAVVLHRRPFEAELESQQRRQRRLQGRDRRVGWHQGLDVVSGLIRLVSGFPPSPAQVRQALTTLTILRGGDPDAIAELGDIGDLPRPRDPATCPPSLRQQVWLWCDNVAGWINSGRSLPISWVLGKSRTMVRSSASF